MVRERPTRARSALQSVANKGMQLLPGSRHSNFKALVGQDATLPAQTRIHRDALQSPRTAANPLPAVLERVLT